MRNAQRVPPRTAQPAALPVNRTPLRSGASPRPMRNDRVPAVNTLKSGGPRLHDPKRPVHPPKKQKLSPRERQRRRARLRDYLFGLAVGLIVFGVAAIFVCQALIGIFA